MLCGRVGDPRARYALISVAKPGVLATLCCQLLGWIEPTSISLTIFGEILTARPQFCRRQFAFPDWPLHLDENS